jgi:hypothetical protein
MRSTLVSLALVAAFGLAPAAAFGQPLYAPSAGPGSFGPGTFAGPSYGAPGYYSYGPATFAPVVANPTNILPFQTNFRDSAVFRGANTSQNANAQVLSLNGQPWIIPKGYQSPADLMSQPRRSSRAPFQYLPTPSRPGP